jgi:hypothetical protein
MPLLSDGIWVDFWWVLYPFHTHTITLSERQTNSLAIDKISGKPCFFTISSIIYHQALAQQRDNHG